MGSKPGKPERNDPEHRQRQDAATAVYNFPPKFEIGSTAETSPERCANLNVKVTIKKTPGNLPEFFLFGFNHAENFW